MAKSMWAALPAAAIAMLLHLPASAATTIPFTYTGGYHFSVASGSGSFTTSVDTGAFGLADITAFSLKGSTSQLADGGSYALSKGDLGSFSGELTSGHLTALSFTTNPAAFPVYAIGTIYEGLGSIDFVVDGLGSGNLTYNVDYFGVPGGAFGDLVIPTTAVPELASWAMMIGGVGVVGGALRRRRSFSIAVPS